MKIHDISMPLVDGMPMWPGDEPFACRRLMTQANGDRVNVSAIGLSVHVGTHADSPWHVDSAGVTMETLDLAIFLGPASVLDVSSTPIIEAEHLEAAAGKLGASTFTSLIADAPRLLLKTMSWPDRAIFPERFATLSEAAAELVVKSGAILLGVDVPSVDQRESTTLPIHHTLIGRRRVGAGVQIVESLLLDRVSPGFYELIALPLNIVGGDGAPVRAVLVERD